MSRVAIQRSHTGKFDGILYLSKRIMATLEMRHLYWWKAKEGGREDVAAGSGRCVVWANMAVCADGESSSLCAQRITCQACPRWRWASAAVCAQGGRAEVGECAHDPHPALPLPSALGSAAGQAFSPEGNQILSSSAGWKTAGLLRAPPLHAHQIPPLVLWL